MAGDENSGADSPAPGARPDGSEGIDLEIRVLGPDDWERLRAIRLEALAESPLSYSSTLEREQAFSEADWRERLGAGFFAVAEVGSRDDALVAAYFPGGVTIEAEMVSLWVRPEARGLGYGGSLVETVALWASTAGAESVHTWMTEPNEQARLLYDNHGFVPTGERQPLPHAPEITEIALRRLL
jgi:GNAT superfamily N-acetyltransferase